ncbi:WhiB family transcriptional regulator [Pseudonocardia sp. MH-G8]|uniref:WhiB family transcriptional regulator n=1 Tax=Pseudonocardia sp. MH-G8 TaxID=1854588 RepID=UPI000BA019FD|nr:WhiB family transcriptional regulator [Pseudonocardia sp. MH-G8]OZM82793.1 transcription factor WhiB [Pseudonocardia sp. MH-G8]
MNGRQGEAGGPDEGATHEQTAAELDALARVPGEVLSQLVATHGLCLWEITYGDPPDWTGEGPPDRELAARLCAGCPVRRECLEFELRTAGAQTVGVWGGLSEDDRRALHAVWQARAGRSDEDETSGEQLEGGEWT